MRKQSNKKGGGLEIVSFKTTVWLFRRIITLSQFRSSIIFSMGHAL